MAQQTYINQELASAYETVFSQYQDGAIFSRLRNQKREIARAGDNIAEHYEIFHSLINFTGYLIGDDTKQVLALILAQGIEKAKSIVGDAREKLQQSSTAPSLEQVLKDTNKAFANKKLASDYEAVFSQYATGSEFSMMRKQKAIIENADVNIADYWASNMDADRMGSLDGLKVKYKSKLLGKQTKKDLELILEHGVEEAKRMITEQREQGLVSVSIRVREPPLSKHRDDERPNLSFDNVEKAYEDT